MAADVTVIGGGISGLACARAATAAGLTVRVLDRGRRVGGRLASRTLWGRPVDHGASYFVVGDSAPFEELVAGWQDGGLARRWTDTFVVIGADGSQTQKPGPMRWAAPQGLRSLAADLADGLDVHLERTVETVEPYRVDGQDAGEVVLAMPASPTPHRAPTSSGSRSSPWRCAGIVDSGRRICTARSSMIIRTCPSSPMTATAGATGPPCSWSIRRRSGRGSISTTR